MGYRVVKLCARCARKVEREGTGFLILRELSYTWRGRPVTGLFCWHEREETPTMVIPRKRDFPRI